MDAGVRVLVVGDRETIAPGLSRHVNGRFDLSVVGSAADVDAAIGLCTTNRIDVVLVDLDSLGRPGVDAIRRLRSEFPEAKVIALTANEATELIVEALTAGASGYAQKSNGIERLAEVIGYAVGGEVVMPEADLVHVLNELHRTRTRSQVQERALERLTAREMDNRRGAWDQPPHGPEPREAHPGQARRSLEGGGRHAGVARRARTDPVRPSRRGSSGAPGRLRGHLGIGMGQGSRTSPDRRSIPFRVVIIDDDDVLRQVVSIACAATAGLEVVGEAQGGEEGLALCERVAPDLVVLDLTLPGMGGLEVATRLRESRGPSRVLVFTAREDGETVLAAMRSGVHGFLAKSAAIDDVASAMLAVARGEPVFPPEHERAAVQELGRLARAARTATPTLTRREITILQLLAEGLTLRQVGTNLGISHRTVESHVTKLYRKLGVKTRVQAMAQGASLGLIEFGRTR